MLGSSVTASPYVNKCNSQRLWFEWLPLQFVWSYVFLRRWDQSLCATSDHDACIYLCRYFRKYFFSFDSRSSLARVCVWQRANRTKKMWKWIWYAEIVTADPIEHTATNGHSEYKTQFPTERGATSDEVTANMKMVSERYAQFHRENCLALYIFHSFIDFFCFLVVVNVNSVRPLDLCCPKKKCSKYEIFVGRVTSTQPKFHLAKIYGISIEWIEIRRPEKNLLSHHITIRTNVVPAQSACISFSLASISLKSCIGIFAVR